ncbi:MAG: hypothetical protein GC204_11210 [Chloroflexi bacterium]|nr:hypothetical protein [Chloroflexota bacterium]
MRNKRLGCSFVARLGLLALGVFCINVPQRWLTPENLPARYDHFAVLGIALHYLGIVIVIIALISLVLLLVKVLRSLF